jgi:hypothetical protein
MASAAFPQAIAAELADQERLMAQQYEYGGGDWLDELEEGGEGEQGWPPLRSLLPCRSNRWVC